MLKTWVWAVWAREGSQWMLNASRTPGCRSLASFSARIPYVLLSLASHNQTFCLQSLSPGPLPPPSTSLCDKLGRFMEGQSSLPALKVTHSLAGETNKKEHSSTLRGKPFKGNGDPENSSF